MDRSHIFDDSDLILQGAEAKIYKCDFLGRQSVVKVRFEKKYRHPELDKKLTHRRITQEARTLMRCRKLGINTPAVYFVDLESNTIFLEHIDSITLKEHIINEKAGIDSKSQSQYPLTVIPVMEMVGKGLAKLHSADIIHGDLTTSNVLIRKETDGFKIFFIDFGLSSSSRLAEDKGVDLYVLEKAFLSTHPNSEELFAALIKSYKADCTSSKPILSKFEEVKLRGRKRTMVG